MWGSGSITSLAAGLHLCKLGVVRMIYQSSCRTMQRGTGANGMKEQGLPSKRVPLSRPAAHPQCVSVFSGGRGVAPHLSGICALIPFCQYILDDNKMWVEFTALQNLVIVGLDLPEILSCSRHVYLLLRTNGGRLQGGYIPGVCPLHVDTTSWSRLISFYIYFYGGTRLQNQPTIMDKFLTL